MITIKIEKFINDYIFNDKFNNLFGNYLIILEEMNKILQTIFIILKEILIRN